jgi:hypothetical protein
MAGFWLFLAALVVFFAVFLVGPTVYRAPEDWRWLLDRSRRHRRRRWSLWGFIWFLLGLATGAAFFGIGVFLLGRLGIEVFALQRRKHHDLLVEQD